MSEIPTVIEFPFELKRKKIIIDKKVKKILEINPNKLTICEPKQIDTSTGILKKMPVTHFIHRVNGEEFDWNILKIKGDEVTKMKI